MTADNRIIIEICADSVASALAAERGGADRVELCSDLAEGGITPSAGLIELVRSRISISLHVMIRPRGGDFCYTGDEIETMRRDVLVAKELGADGIVCGLLDPAGNVDVEQTRPLVELARPMQFTFHRAFDLAIDLKRGLEDVCAAGADRLLTSGGEASALAGGDVIAGLVQAAKDRVAIMACGGVNAGNAGEVVQRTGVKEVHAGLRTAVFASSQQEPKRSCAPDSRGRLSLHRLSLQRLSQHMSFDPPEVREADVAELRRAVSPRPV